MLSWGSAPQDDGVSLVLRLKNLAWIRHVSICQELFCIFLNRKFKKSNFDHEADQEADSTSNLELSRVFVQPSRMHGRAVRCRRTTSLGAENRTF